MIFYFLNYNLLKYIFFLGYLLRFFFIYGLIYFIYFFLFEDLEIILLFFFFLYNGIILDELNFFLYVYLFYF